ncbi:MAG: COX15/CtaA family protein, partial [Myxococcota bacterium]
MARLTAFQRFAIGLLGYTMLVILWGAYVRATGSGAGCGDHWPLCNGEVLPRSPTAETVVELTHRVTSGLAWVGALVLLVWSRRVAPRGSRLRFAAAASFVLMCTEALVGAGLVLFELVAENRSLARGYWMAAHLTNTFLLLWAMGFAVWSALRTGALRVPRWSGALFGLVGVAFLIVGASGSVAALGATLFPAESIQEGLAQDLSPGAHLFVRLRLYHPILALVGFGL